MKSLIIKDPPELRRKMELFIAEQRTLNKKRLDLLESLRFVEAAGVMLLAIVHVYTNLYVLCLMSPELVIFCLVCSLHSCHLFLILVINFSVCLEK